MHTNYSFFSLLRYLSSSCPQQHWTPTWTPSPPLTFKAYLSSSSSKIWCLYMFHNLPSLKHQAFHRFHAMLEGLCHSNHDDPIWHHCFQVTGTGYRKVYSDPNAGKISIHKKGHPQHPGSACKEGTFERREIYCQFSLLLTNFYCMNHQDILIGWSL